MINCLVVEDEPIARKGMVEHIRKIDFLNPAAVCKDPVEAIVALEKYPIDIIFLDIQMPKITGIDFIKRLQNPPIIILTTAYPEYAIEGYELDILDYLLKPISFQRFFKAVVKARAYMNLKGRQEAMDTENYFYIKANQKIEKIIISDILYIEAMANYVILYTKKNKHIAYMSFKGIESQLPGQLFLKIHKSFIVAVNAIETISNDEVKLGGNTLPIGKSFKSSVMERVEERLLKRL